MSILGKVRDGVVILDDGNALPDGTVVRVEPVGEAEASNAATPVGEVDEARVRASATRQTPASAEGEGATLAERLRGLAGIAKGLPPDLARNHDHYLHGRPKK